MTARVVAKHGMAGGGGGASGQHFLPVERDLLHAQAMHVHHHGGVSPAGCGGMMNGVGRDAVDVEEERRLGGGGASRYRLRGGLLLFSRRGVGRPEMTAACGADPELVRRPWPARPGVAHLHLGTAPLTTNVMLEVVAHAAILMLMSRRRLAVLTLKQIQLVRHEIGEGRSHDISNVPFVLAGGGKAGVGTGRYLKLAQTYNNRLLVSLCHFMGYTDVQKFGSLDDGTGPLPGLLV